MNATPDSEPLLAWSREYAHPPAFTDAGSGRLMVSDGTATEAMRMPEGSRIWRSSAVGGYALIPYGETLLAVRGARREGLLEAFALGAADGKLMWKARHEVGWAFRAFRGLLPPGSAADPELLLLPGPGNAVSVLDRATGRARSRLPFHKDDHVWYLASAHGAVWIVASRKGKLALERYEVPGRGLSSRIPGVREDMNKPVFGDEDVLWADGRQLLVIDPKRAAVRHRTSVHPMLMDAIGVAGRAAFVESNLKGPRGLYRVDLRTGKARCLRTGNLNVQGFSPLNGEILALAFPSLLIDPGTLQVRPSGLSEIPRDGISGRAALIGFKVPKLAWLGNAAGAAPAPTARLPARKRARLPAEILRVPEPWSCLGWFSAGGEILLKESEGRIARWQPGQDPGEIPLFPRGALQPLLQVHAWDSLSNRIMFTWRARPAPPPKGKLEKLWTDRMGAPGDGWRTECRDLANGKTVIHIDSTRELDGGWLLPGGEPLLLDRPRGLFTPLRGGCAPMKIPGQAAIRRADLARNDRRPLLSLSSKADDHRGVWRFDFSRGSRERIHQSRLEAILCCDPAGESSLLLEGRTLDFVKVVDAEGNDLFDSLLPGRKARYLRIPPAFAPGGGRAAFVFWDGLYRSTVVLYDLPSRSVIGETAPLPLKPPAGGSGFGLSWASSGRQVLLWGGSRAAVIQIPG